MSGDDKDDDSQGENLVFDNDNTDFTTNLTDGDPAWMLLLAVADDDYKDDPGDYDKFRSDYDLDDEGVFDNDDIDNGEGCVNV